MSLIEIIGVGSGAWDVWLCAREHIWNWPVGLVNSVAFLLLFLQTGLYGSVAMQVVYIALGFWGWYEWLFVKGVRVDRPIRKLSYNEFVFMLPIGVIITWVIFVLLITTNDPAPELDAITTGLSLMATYMLALKIEENWWTWIAADVIFIVMYIQQGLMLVGGLYIIFLLTCIYGLKDWKRKRHEEDEQYGTMVNDIVYQFTGVDE